MSAAAGALRVAAECYHCGLPVPAGVDLQVEMEGAARAMCCRGCEAVAQMIVEQGLVDYYRHRETPGARPEPLVPAALDAMRVFDDSEIQRDFVAREGPGRRRATLSVEGLTCAACAWLIERHVRRIPGVQEMAVSLSSHRAQLSWDPEIVRFSDVLASLAELGYPARPFEPDRDEAREREEDRRALRRLGVAGLGAMQVMMYAVGLYAGALEGIDDRYRALLHWVSWLVATPVVFYAAQPFFAGAWRDVRAGRPGMDVPVALAIGGAYVASVGSTLSGTGPVYFESVCMFTFFLTLGRYVEQRIRRRADARSRRLLRGVPRIARRVVGGVSAQGEETIPASRLAVKDCVRVRAGEVIPADGFLLAGRGSVDESLLTGEPLPRAKQSGDVVLGGSVLVEGAIEMSVTRVGPETTIASISALEARAQADRPAIAEVADRVARVFVAAVLVAAAMTWLVWTFVDAERAFPIALSVLVATCPCALALATPAALAAANSALSGRGLLVLRGHVLSGLARATRVVFDKTGTLTRGAPELVAIRSLREADTERCVAVACALEADSAHPIARAFERRAATTRLRPVTSDLTNRIGFGIEGRVDGVAMRIGRPDWALAIAPVGASMSAPPADADRAILLASERGPEAWFGLRDELRPGARELVETLRARGIALTLLSGDPSDAAPRLADRVGIDHVIHGVTPELKRDAVAALQDDGDVVVMVGDGINDAPGLGQAQVAIAMGSGSDLTRLSADAVLVDDRLDALAEALPHAVKARRVIAQNLCWALVYNAAVLPLAMAGWIPPWLAALGMSTSSLLVVGNALRLAGSGEARADFGLSEASGRAVA